MLELVGSAFATKFMPPVQGSWLLAQHGSAFFTPGVDLAAKAMR